MRAYSYARTFWHTFLHEKILSSCSMIVAVAQVHAAIPALWKLVISDISKIERRDLNILPSLARLNEDKAATLLCNYYTQSKDTVKYMYILRSRELSYSLHQEVLQCLIADFMSLNRSISFRDGDVFFHPAHYLAGSIVSMLGNCPYRTGPFSEDPEKLYEWLSKGEKVILKEK